MKVGFYEIGEIDDSLLKFAVIATRYHDKWVYCKHKLRETWEVPGGRREQDEDISDTAKRELFEETGAKEFSISPVCIYSVNDESFGMLFFAEVTEFGELPESEIESIEFFRDIPSNLTYPLIQPKLIDKVKEVVS